MSRSSNEWHLRDSDSVISILNTDRINGLNRKEVARRRRKEGPNNVWYMKNLRPADYFKSLFGDPTLAVLVLAVVTATIFEKIALAIPVIVLLVIGITARVIVYLKSRAVFEKNMQELIPCVTVIREGMHVTVRADEIVPGDIVILRSGDISPCDGRIISEGEVTVSERGITANKTYIVKRDTIIISDKSEEIPCEYRVNTLFAGSVILKGSCRMVATSCSEDTLVVRKSGGIMISDDEEVALFRYIDSNCSTGNIFMLIMVFILSVLSLLLTNIAGIGDSFTDAFILSMALAVSCWSGIYSSFGSISLAVQMRELANLRPGHSVIRKVSDLEDIASVRKVIFPDISYFKSGKTRYSAFYENGVYHALNEDEAVSDGILPVIGNIAGGAALMPQNSDEPFRNGDYISETVSRLLNDDERYMDAVRKISIPLTSTSVDTGRSVVHNAVSYENGEFYYYCISDPSTVLSFCDSVMVSGRISRLGIDERQKILGIAGTASDKGSVVIAAARRVSSYSTLKRVSALQDRMCFLGFCIIDDESAMPGDRADGDDSGIYRYIMSSSPETDRNYLITNSLISDDAAVISYRDIVAGEKLPEKDSVIYIPVDDTVESGLTGSLKIKLATAKKIASVHDDTAVVTDKPYEAGLIHSNSVGISAGRSGSNTIPHILKNRTKVSAYPGCSAGFGGIREIKETVRYSLRGLENLCRISRYGILSTSLRVVIVLISVLTGWKLITPQMVILSGAVIDLFAMCVLSFSKEDGERWDRKRLFPRGAELFRYIGITAFLCIIQIAAMIICSKATGTEVLTDGSAALPVFASLILMQFILLSEMTGSRISKLYANMIYLLFAASVAVILILTVFSSSFCAFIGGMKTIWQLYLISLVSPLILLVTTEILKRNKYIKKEKESEDSNG